MSVRLSVRQRNRNQQQHCRQVLYNKNQFINASAYRITVAPDTYQGKRMRTKTLILWLLLSVTIPSFAYDFQSGDLCYNITSDSTVEVTRDSINYYEELTNIIIPESVTYNGTTYSVTNIDNYAFTVCGSLTSVTIPNSVTSIGGYAFNSCAGLTSVTIPNSVTTIGEWAFGGCTGLTSVTIPNSVTSIGSWAFNRVCNIVYSGTATDSPWGARSINGYVDGYLVYSDTTKTTLLACSSAATESITIPDGVTSIGSWAFKGCTGLTSVTVPNSVTTIGYDAFQSVFYVVYSGTATGSPWGAKSVNGYVDGYLVYSDSTKTALQGCSTAATGAITIPNSVTSIGNFAFIYCTGLTSITIPDGVTTIGEDAFYGCTGLTSVTIPNGVTTIGMSAFHGCRNLASITIPNSVTYIDCWAFHETPWYENQQDGVVYINDILYHYKGTMPQGTNITIKDGTTMIVTSAFLDCTGLTSVTIPNSVTTIGRFAFSGCKGLTSVTIPDGVTTIGEDAFYNCTGLTSVTIPNSVTTIGSSAFNSCSSLISITIPNSVTLIEDFVFRNCTSLTSITIPNSVTSIGRYAFEGCTELTSVTIPDGVTSIGDYAFSGCTGLTSVTIPNSVTSIGEKAFRLVANIVYSGTETGSPWGARSVNGHVDGNFVYSDSAKTTLLACSSIATGTITIPNSVTSIGNRAFYGCTGLTSITIPNSVTSIKGHAFRDCTGLTSITIPNGVKSIFAYTFYGCTGLTSITIPNKVRMIETLTFTGCTSLTSFTCYAIKPPTVLTYNGTDGVPLESIVLYVPEESVEEYRTTQWWKDFKEIKAIGATPVEADEPILTPDENKVTITWPTTDNADTYTIDIHKDDELISTLTFDANGVLQSMRSAAPARYATQHTTQAKATDNGFRFVVEGLDYATTYTYSITATDKDETVLTTYDGTFTTKSPAGIEDILSTPSQPATRKVFLDGQVYILHGDKTYTLQGAEVK